MEPTIKNGSILLVFQWSYLWSDPKVSDIVVFKNPSAGQILCKRIAAYDSETAQYALQGDNLNDSLDSRQFGKIQKSQILGKIITAR